MTGDPVQEVYAAKEILKAMGLRKEGVEIVSCPTCGRTCTDLLSAANRVEHELSSLIPKGKYLKVAVMGCIVNGPGEAAEADIGVAFGKGGCALFKGGKLFQDSSSGGRRRRADSRGEGHDGIDYGTEAFDYI